MKSQALKDELKDAGQAYNTTFVYSLIPAICFRNEGWLKESLEEKGGEKGSVREFIKFLPNTSLIIRG